MKLLDQVLVALMASGQKHGEIAKKAGLSKNYLSQIINGHKKPGVDVCESLVEVLGMKILLYKDGDSDVLFREAVKNAVKK